MTDSGHLTEQTDRCEECGDSESPTRSIKMLEGGRRMLCLDCYIDAVDSGEVDPTDARVEVRR